jgi:hypothetical protein
MIEWPADRAGVRRRIRASYDVIAVRTGSAPSGIHCRPAGTSGRHPAVPHKRRTTSTRRSRPPGHCNDFRHTACARAHRRRKRVGSERGRTRIPTRTAAIRPNRRSTRRRCGISRWHHRSTARCSRPPESAAGRCGRLSRGGIACKQKKSRPRGGGFATLKFDQHHRSQVTRPRYCRPRSCRCGCPAGCRRKPSGPR